MATYEVVDNDLIKRIDHLLKSHHKELHGFNLDVRGLMAWGEDGKPAIKIHGVKCLATVSLVGQKERIQGLGDAQIVIDGEEWEDRNQRERDAILDHQMEHIIPKTNKKGEIMRDGNNRVIFKLRNHDWDIGGFQLIAERYGADSIEQHETRLAMDEYG